MTEFTLGASASCTDGHCGEVVRTILDPATRTITHLVIEPRHRGAEGRLVPLHLVDAAGGEIRLRCSLAEFERLEPAEEVDLVDDAGYGSAGSVQGYGNVGGMGVGGSASGMGIGLSICRSIVEAGGGRIWATRDDGAGATFHVLFPSQAS